MDKSEKAPIVVKRVIKGGGHHGGAWKVAYADFVTAMMAFFLLMWLLGSTSGEQRAAISDYFNNPSAEMGASPQPRVGGGEGPGGGSTSPIDLGGGADQPPAKATQETPDLETLEELAAQAEQARMEDLAEKVLEAVEQSQTLAPFKEQLLIDMTNEGLRIQIVDKENRPMFDLGSARLLPHMEGLLREIARTINQVVPNRISVTGHTDARPYTNPRYSNWELSTDRANAARREMEAGGMLPERVAKVVGLSSSVLFDSKNPTAPINRRIAIIVLTKHGEEALDAQPQPTPGEPAPPGAKPGG